jgi:hypothetical protein
MLWHGRITAPRRSSALSQRRVNSGVWERRYFRPLLTSVHPAQPLPYSPAWQRSTLVLIGGSGVHQRLSADRGPAGRRSAAHDLRAA